MLTEIFLDTYYNYICFMFQNIEIQVKKRSKFSKKRLFLLSYGQTRYTTVTNYTIHGLGCQRRFLILVTITSV